MRVGRIEVRPLVPTASALHVEVCHGVAGNHHRGLRGEAVAPNFRIAHSSRVDLGDDGVDVNVGVGCRLAVVGGNHNKSVVGLSTASEGIQDPLQGTVEAPIGLEARLGERAEAVAKLVDSRKNRMRRGEPLVEGAQERVLGLICRRLPVARDKRAQEGRRLRPAGFARTRGASTHEPRVDISHRRHMGEKCADLCGNVAFQLPCAERGHIGTRATQEPAATTSRPLGPADAGKIGTRGMNACQKRQVRGTAHRGKDRGRDRGTATIDKVPLQGRQIACGGHVRDDVGSGAVDEQREYCLPWHGNQTNTGGVQASRPTEEASFPFQFRNANGVKTPFTKIVRARRIT